MTHDRKAINTLVAQPAAGAEPSDMAHEIWAAAQLAPGEGIVDGAARVEALLSRYGRPAGDAQPVADHKFYPHPGYRAFCQKCGKAEADHPTAPVAAQKADGDGPTRPICGCPGGRHSGGSTCTSAAIAQQRQGE